MTSNFEAMGHKFGDKFVVVKDYSDFKVGDVVTAVESVGGYAVTCVKEGDTRGYAMYFSGPYDIEIIPFKETPKTNTLNVGEVGSPRYEVIRKVLAVLDGDEVKVFDKSDYDTGNYITSAADCLVGGISYQTNNPQGYQLKSEQPVLSEKDLKIKELEDNIEAMKKNLEELKGM